MTLDNIENYFKKTNRLEIRQNTNTENPPLVLVLRTVLNYLQFSQKLRIKVDLKSNFEMEEDK